ncbi:hypothetical protein J2X31_003207 [Flavobacterium arsenatis]|uniref:Bacterial EndoU nuclease domain-containing protein n=1 Tax=Flavobacterium arsenatis TaxID=1484332 RepID=A0ABU1TTH2_9FLAO|nr:hypothetical protein [Flavobacterium arsenatis]MDR6969180.1 hypothetical protein [Flavobacterium arsenatis]
MGNKQESRTNSQNSVKSFEEITYDKKYDQNNKCKEHVNDFYTEKMDIDALIKDIKTNKEFSYFFYHQKYTLSTHNNSLGISPTTLAPVSAGSTYYQSNPFTYKNPITNTDQVAHLKVSLNKRACHISLANPGFLFYVSAKSENIFYEIKYIYNDALDKKNYSVTPDIEADYTIESKYVAINIATGSANDMLAIAKELGNYDFIKEQIKNTFITKINATKEPSELKFLYENLPDVLTREIGADLEYALLFDHFKILTNYDNVGYFSGWKDSSNALIKNLQCLTVYNRILLLDLLQSPKLVKQVYINLDGESEIEGMLIKNRTIYTTILSSICLINGFQDLKFTGKTFKYGKEYKLDSNVNWLNDDGNDVIFLKQQIVKTQTVKKTIATGIPSGSSNQDYEGTESHIEDVDAGAYYSPLDIVAFIDYSQENSQTEYVPAIFLKSISDEEEWIYINRMIRIGIDVAAVILGLATLGSSSGFWAIIAGVDIALAGLDAIIQANYDEIKSASPEGEKFLQAYEKFILAAGVATSIPLLASAPSVLAGLAKLTSKTVAGSRNFVRAAITRAILEINIANFTKNTVKEIIYGEEALKLSGVHFNTAGITRLQEQGVLFIKGIDFDGKVAGYAAIYKGEVIAQGTAKQVRDELKDLWSRRGSKLIDALKSSTRKAVFKRWGNKFENKFHLHFDGEFTIGKLSNRDATQVLKGTGGHNHSVIGENIRVRKYLTQPVDGHPFDALIEVRYKNGQWIEKQAKSSMFPINWNIQRVKEEIALVYENMIKSGTFEQIKNHKSPSFKTLDSTEEFEIKIEFDEIGNITNAYPNIKY